MASMNTEPDEPFYPDVLWITFFVVNNIDPDREDLMNPLEILLAREAQH